MKYLPLLLLLLFAACTPDPKPGEVWLYQYGSTDKNPYSKTYGQMTLGTYQEIVLSTKDGWVEWSFVGSSHPFYSTIHDFEISTHKIK